MAKKKNKRGQPICNKTPNALIPVAEHWLGYCRSIQKVVPLNDEFVTTNFTPGFIEQVRTMALQEDTATSFIQVPPGDDKTHENVPLDLQTGPVVKF